MSNIEYSVSTADEKAINWIEMAINNKFFVARSREMAIECLGIFKLRFPKAEDALDEAMKGDTYDKVIDSRARIFGAVSKQAVKEALHKA